MAGCVVASSQADRKAARGRGWVWLPETAGCRGRPTGRRYEVLYMPKYTSSGGLKPRRRMPSDIVARIPGRFNRLNTCLRDT